MLIKTLSTIIQFIYKKVYVKNHNVFFFLITVNEVKLKYILNGKYKVKVFVM
jgi:hypothetical protein